MPLQAGGRPHGCVTGDAREVVSVGGALASVASVVKDRVLPSVVSRLSWRRSYDPLPRGPRCAVGLSLETAIGNGLMMALESEMSDLPSAFFTRLGSSWPAVSLQWYVVTAEGAAWLELESS